MTERQARMVSAQKASGDEKGHWDTDVLKMPVAGGYQETSAKV